MGLVQAGWLPLLATLAYVPILIRAFWGILVPDERLNLRKIGYTELGYTLAFVILLTVGWTIGG